MTPIPTEVADLIAELEAMYPPRCVSPNENVNDAHRYSGQVDLVQALRLRYEWTKARDPLGRVLPANKRNASHVD